MEDNRNYGSMLEHTEGYEDAIVVPEINANNFEIKHGLLNLVQNKQFFGHDKEDPHAHIQYFNKITSTELSTRPSTVIKLMLFQPFSSRGSPNLADKETPSIDSTWDDLQRFDESFYEAWDQFNDLLRACPHHSKPVVAKVMASTSTSGKLFPMSRTTNMVKALLLDKKNQSQAPAHQTPAPVKAVEQSCVTCGGGHSYQNCPATDGNIYRDNIQEYVSQAAAVNYNQGNASYRPQMVANQIRPPGFPPMQNHQNNQNRGINFNQNRGNNFNQNRGNNFNQGQVYQPQINQPPTFQDQAPVPPAPGVSKPDFYNYVKANDAVMQNNQMANITDLITKFVNSNTASTSGLGSLPSNTIANPKGDVKAITTRSGVSYNGPQISSSKEKEKNPR
ncbi:hypothetical protein Tco_1399874 [Tanacetum coccineum]